MCSLAMFNKLPDTLLPKIYIRPVFDVTFNRNFYLS